MGRRVKIPWIGGQNTMGRGVRYTMGSGVKIPWIGSQNTMGRWFDIHVPWIGGSKYHE